MTAPNTPPAPTRPPISALVTTFNEEAHIEACLDSLLWCDEILVVDSFSTDRTVEIIRAVGARHGNLRLVEREYFGAAAQKNWAMGEVVHDWILIFDADERCLAPLRDEIQALLARGPDHDAYTIHRRVYFLGRRIRFSGWRNDQVVRLVRRGTARYPNRRVHADMATEGPAPRLRHSMDHLMVDDLHTYIQRIVKYGQWGAGQAYREGKRAGFAEVLGRPLWRFVRTYVFQGGVLDGMTGLVFCMLQAFGTYVKWSLVWSWRVNEARGAPLSLPAFDDDEETWQGLEGLKQVR